MTWGTLKLPDKKGSHSALLDLAPAVEFDWHCAYGNVQAVRPGMPVFQLSAKNGGGMGEFLSFLTARLDELRTLAAS